MLARNGLRSFRSGIGRQALGALGATPALARFFLPLRLVLGARATFVTTPWRRLVVRILLALGVAPPIALFRAISGGGRSTATDLLVATLVIAAA